MISFIRMVHSFRFKKVLPAERNLYQPLLRPPLAGRDFPSPPIRKHRFDSVAMEIPNGYFQIAAAAPEVFRLFLVQRMNIHENVIAAASRAGIVQEAHAFQPKGFAVRLHSFGFFLDQVLGGKTALAMRTFSVHRFLPAENGKKGLMKTVDRDLTSPDRGRNDTAVGLYLYYFRTADRVKRRKNFVVGTRLNGS
jgi:hypothetical protein